MPMPLHWLGSCKLQTAAAAPRPLQQQQQHLQQHAAHSSSYPCCSSSNSSSSSPCSSSTHRPPAASAAGPAAPSSSSTWHVRTVTASAAAAAAGAFPLPDPSSFLEHSRPLSNSSSSSSVAASAAAVDALTGSPPHGWQISTHIRHSVEEAMKASIGGMGFVHLPHHSPYLQQQQQQQQEKEEEEEWQQQEEEQQQHPSWQRLVLDMGQVEAQHTTAPFAAAVDSSTDASGSSSSSSSSMLLSKSTQQIQQCKSAAALEQLLQQSWQHMDHIHVAAAFVQLARIQQQQQQQSAHAPPQPAAAAAAAVHSKQQLSHGGWSMLQQVALQQLPNLQSRQCANILWACASLRAKPSDALMQGLLARSQTLLAQGTTPQGFANTIWGLASLRVQPGGEWLDTFFGASQRQLCNFQPQELSSTIWALAQLRQQPSREWYAAFLTASAAKLGACSAQSLCNKLWGVARLGLTVPDYWWSALTYACSVRAAELTPAGVCQVLWGAGMVAGKQQRRCQQQQEQQDSALQPPQQQQQQQLRRKQSWGYVADVGWSSRSDGGQAAAAAVRSSTQWLEPLLAAVEPQLQQLNSTAVSSLLWALAVLDHDPGAAFVGSCLSSIGAQGGLAPSNAVHALWAASGTAGERVNLAKLQPLLLQLQQQGMECCKPQEFVYMAAALANLSKQQQHQVLSAQPPSSQQQHGLLPPLPTDPQISAQPGAESAAAGLTSPPDCVNPSALLDSLAQQLLSASKLRLPQFHLGQLCQLGRWLLAAGVRPDASWVDSYLAATAPYLHTLQPGQQLLLLHAVQHWGVALQPGWVALFLGACTSDLALRGYTAGHIGALLQAFAAAQLQPQQHHLKQLLQRVLQPDAQLDAPALAAVLSGLFSLGFRPPDGWVQQLWAAGTAAMLRATPEGLVAVAAALQHQGVRQLSLRPNRPFAGAFHAGVAALLPQLQPQQAAAVLAALTAARMKPSGQQEHLLPGLMTIAVKGMYSMPLSNIVAAWWGLVLPRVLSVAVPLEHLQAAAPAAAAAGQQQDQQWLQQQWQTLWLRRIFSSSSSGGGVEQLMQLQPVSLLQLADCLRRLQQPVPESWADAYVAAVSVHIPRMAPHELHLLLHAVPCLEGAAALPEFAGRLMAAAESVLQDFGPSQLSDILYSIQQAGMEPPEPWLKGYIAAATLQLPQFWPRQLTRVLTALARLRFMPDATFLSAATEAAVNHLPKYRVPPSEMVDLLWAIVALRVRPSAAWMARFEGRLLERGPEQLDGQQLSRLGWCMSALQRKPGRVLWAKWLAATEQQMSVMDSSSLADILWTCAMQDEQPSRTWLDAFTSSSAQYLSTFSSSSLVTVVWSLALLQHRPPSDWMLDCFAALSRSFAATAAAVAADRPFIQQQQQRGAELLGPAQVTRLSWALAALDCQLPANISAGLLQLCLLHVPQLDADSLAQLVWAWDRLDGTQDKQLVQQIATAARAQLMPHAHGSLMGVVGTHGVYGAYASASANSSSGRRGVADSALQRPATRVRLGQQRVVLRHSTSSSVGGGSGSGRAVVVGTSRGVQEGSVLTSAPGLLGFSPQRGLFGGSGRGKVGTKQQLMATLQKIYASDLKLGGNSSSAAAAADAEVSVA